MTNDAIASDLTARIIARADALLDAESDAYDHDTAAELLELLDIPTRTPICHMHEICPIHLCDDQICADDDDPACAAERA